MAATTTTTSSATVSISNAAEALHDDSMASRVSMGPLLSHQGGSSRMWHAFLHPAAPGSAPPLQIVAKRIDLCAYRGDTIRPKLNALPRSKRHVADELDALADLRDNESISKLLGRAIDPYGPGVYLYFYDLTVRGMVNLEEWLWHRPDRATLSAFCGLGHQIASGLAFIHWHKRKWGDCKPENIMTDGCQIKLIDFGTAKRTTDSGFHYNSCTPLYRSSEERLPDGKDGAVNLTLASDIFSLGTVLFEFVNLCDQRFAWQLPVHDDHGHPTGESSQGLPLDQTTINSRLRERFDTSSSELARIPFMAHYVAGVLRQTLCAAPTIRWNATQVEMYLSNQPQPPRPPQQVMQPHYPQHPSTPYYAVPPPPMYQHPVPTPHPFASAQQARQPPPIWYGYASGTPDRHS